MRLPRIRLSVGGLMILIAAGTILVAGVIELAKLMEKRSAYLDRVGSEALNVEALRKTLANDEAAVVAYRRHESEGAPPPPANMILGPNRSWGDYVKLSADKVRKGREEIAHRAALVEKYRRAARRPWATVEPDPPWPN